MYETPRNNGAMSQGHTQHEGRFTAQPGTLFGNPLESDEEYRKTANVNPVYSVPVLADQAEHSYVGGNVVQVSEPDRSLSSGAGLGGSGQLVPVPVSQVGTTVASSGSGAVVPVQSSFPAGIQSVGVGHSVSTPAVVFADTVELVPASVGQGGFVDSLPAPMVSAGIGASVGGRQPASEPVDTSVPGMAGFVPFAARSLVNGGTARRQSVMHIQQ